MAAVLFAVFGCGSSRVVDHRDERFDRALAEAIAIFREYSLPNSMARPSGFDLKGHLRQLKERLDEVTIIFHNPQGVAYLAEHVDREGDELAILCILGILSESRDPAASKVFEKYAHHDNERVADFATRALILASVPVNE